MVGRDAAEKLFPEVGVEGFREEGGDGAEGEPGVLEDFVFELAGSPCGVADGCLDDDVFIFDGFGGGFCGDLGLEGDGAVGEEADGREGELLCADGAAAVNGDGGEGCGGEVGDDIADGGIGGVVDDGAEGAGFGAVFGEEDDGVVEGSVVQGGCGEEELSFEGDGEFGIWCFGSHVVMIAGR